MKKGPSPTFCPRFSWAMLLATFTPGLLAADSTTFTLWPSDRPFPAVKELAFPEGMTHTVIERSDTDRYKFLHDPAIAAHKGVLFAAWYNCPEKEMVGESLIRARRSADGGRTWSAPEVIASDRAGEGVLYGTTWCSTIRCPTTRRTAGWSCRWG
jgi:hypothetical protein